MPHMTLYIPPSQTHRASRYEQHNASPYAVNYGEIGGLWGSVLRVMVADATNPKTPPSAETKRARAWFTSLRTYEDREIVALALDIDVSLINTLGRDLAAAGWMRNAVPGGMGRRKNVMTGALN